eukprot:scaffold2522_cov242-Pinguiococcus_pyrenoidosus.AAC.8
MVSCTSKIAAPRAAWQGAVLSSRTGVEPACRHTLEASSARAWRCATLSVRGRRRDLLRGSPVPILALLSVVSWLVLCLLDLPCFVRTKGEQARRDRERGGTAKLIL